MSDKKREIVHIYRIYFPESDKCYIGQTVDIKNRMRQHLQMDSLVHRALLKYDDWGLIQLHVCYSRDEANRVEIEEIRNFDSIKPNGYNLTAGGSAGEHCEETKEKIRQARLGFKHSDKSIEKMRQSQLGVIPSQETRDKISRSNMGHKLSPEVKENLRRVNLGNKHAAGNKWNVGRKHTQKSKDKARQSMLGYRRTDEHKHNMKIAQIKRYYREYKQKIKELEEKLGQDKANNQ